MSNFRTYLAVFWPSVVVIAVIALGYLLYSNSLSLTRTEIEVTLNTISAMNDDLANSQAIVDRYNSARSELEPHLSSLFPSSRPQALIDNLKKTAARHNVRLADFRLDVPKFIEIRGRKETISIVPFEISFKGSFLRLGEFLERLEKTPYLHAVSSTGLSIQDDSGGLLILSIKGAFRFFSKETVEEIIADGK